MSHLQGKTVFVTGASSGIGEATAQKFAQAGCKLVLAARRFERLQAVASKLPTKCHLIELDVQDRLAVEQAVASIPPDFAAIDILVNNAGKARGLAKLHEADIADQEEMINTNVKGLLYCTRAVVPGMIKRQSGHVINIGSIAGHDVYPNGSVYCASKFAVDALTKGLRLDLVDTPIRVSTVDPGAVETEFSLVRFHGDEERAKKVYQGFRPLAAEDVADAVLWVAERPAHIQIAEVIILPTSQANAYVTHKTQ
ncbi:MAG: SDR family oxidoreductase [bacterium]|nr:SDR family oxidoreductase [bacterium]